MTGFLIYLAVTLGVAVSIALPLIRPLIPKPPATKTFASNNWWAFAKPYLITGVFSLVVALILVAFLGETLDTWQKAFLAGYTADSTLQKITT
ncbi:MAG: hypothetical protein WAM82_14030 [Thermoanaerobaculia bacterium]